MSRVIGSFQVIVVIFVGHLVDQLAFETSSIPVLCVDEGGRVVRTSHQFTSSAILQRLRIYQVRLLRLVLMVQSGHILASRSELVPSTTLTDSEEVGVLRSSHSWIIHESIALILFNGRVKEATIIFWVVWKVRWACRWCHLPATLTSWCFLRRKIVSIITKVAWILRHILIETISHLILQIWLLRVVLWWESWRFWAWTAFFCIILRLRLLFLFFPLPMPHETKDQWHYLAHDRHVGSHDKEDKVVNCIASIRISIYPCIEPWDYKFNTIKYCPERQWYSQ